MIVGSWPGHFNLSIYETIMEFYLTARRPSSPPLMSSRGSFARGGRLRPIYRLVLLHRRMSHGAESTTFTAHDYQNQRPGRFSKVSFRHSERIWDGDANVGPGHHNPIPGPRRCGTVFLGLGKTGPGRLAFWRALPRPLPPSLPDKTLRFSSAPAPCLALCGGGGHGVSRVPPVLMGHMVLVQCSTRARPLAWELAVDRQSNRG